jgi:large subunit ribosomal protein L17
MRHKRAGKKLGRSASHRDAMMRNMVTSFLKEEKVVTTDMKAKLLKSLTDKMVTLGKQGDLHARRQVAMVVQDRTASKKLFEEISPRFQDRQGGYTRSVKIGNRHGDNAPISVVEFVAKPEEKPKAKKGRQKKAQTEE